jgi:RNA methyltransferase, TrmH family
VQRLRRLLRRRSFREAEGVFVVEGPLAIAAALDAGAPIEALFVAPSADAALVDRATEAGIRVHELAPGVIERVADTVSPQAAIAVARAVDRPLESVAHAEFVVVCIDVRDPGNAGTVLRSAEAAGADGVLCTEGCVDVYNPKTVRASAGALFHIPVVVGGDPLTIVQQLGAWGFTRVGAAARGGLDPATCDLAGRVALVVGNEARGFSVAIDDALDTRVTIPMKGRAESLNVGMAATVLSFEVARQRRVLNV